MARGKGLVNMTAAGAPVLPSFTITTQLCVAYMETGKFPDGLWEQTLEAMKDIEAQTGKKFGDSSNPLVSVRSGGRMSMPGMMDTVLNLGLNDDTRAALARLTGNAGSRTMPIAASSRCSLTLSLWAIAGITLRRS